MRGICTSTVGHYLQERIVVDRRKGNIQAVRLIVKQKYAMPYFVHILECTLIHNICIGNCKDNRWNGRGLHHRSLTAAASASEHVA